MQYLALIRSMKIPYRYGSLPMIYIYYVMIFYTGYRVPRTRSPTADVVTIVYTVL